MDNIMVEIINAFKMSTLITFITAILVVRILKADIKDKREIINENILNLIENVQSFDSVYITKRIYYIGKKYGIFNVKCSSENNKVIIGYSFKNIMYLSNVEIQVDY